MTFTKLCTVAAVSLLATFSPALAKDVDKKATTSKAKTTLEKASAKVSKTKDKVKSKATSTTKAASSSAKNATSSAKSKADSTLKKASKSSGISTPDKKTLEGMKKSASSLSATQSKAMLKTLNSGTNAELVAIPGIGEKTAQSIKGARPFKSVTDLGNIKGIGAKKFAGVVKHFKK